MATYKDTHYRSILKAISFRCVASLTTVVTVFILTRFLKLDMSVSLKLSGLAGVADVVSKLILYYFHERIWDALGIGRKEHPLSSLPVKKPLSEKSMEEIKNKLKELGYISED